MLPGAASEPPSATPYPTVYFKFEINSGWTNFEGGKGKGLVRCVREEILFPILSCKIL